MSPVDGTEVLKSSWHSKKLYAVCDILKMAGRSATPSKNWASGELPTVCIFLRLSVHGYFVVSAFISDSSDFQNIVSLNSGS